jgi:hypothetical protein
MAETAPRRALQQNMDRYRRSLLAVGWLTVVLAALHLAEQAALRYTEALLIGNTERW